MRSIQFLVSVSASSAMAAATGAICGEGAMDVGERFDAFAGGVNVLRFDVLAGGVNDGARVRLGACRCDSLERRRFAAALAFASVPGFEKTGGPRTTFGRLPLPRRRRMEGTRTN